MPGVVGRVLLAVLLMQLAEPQDHILDSGLRRQVDDERPDLGAQEVVRAGRAQSCQRGQLCSREEVQDNGRVVEVPDLCVVRRCETTDYRNQGRSAFLALVLGEWFEPGNDRTERLCRPAAGDELLRRTDDAQRVRLALRRRRTPGSDAMAAQDDPNREWVRAVDLGDV